MSIRDILTKGECRNLIGVDVRKQIRVIGNGEHSSLFTLVEFCQQSGVKGGSTYRVFFKATLFNLK